VIVCASRRLTACCRGQNGGQNEIRRGMELKKSFGMIAWILWSRDTLPLCCQRKIVDAMNVLKGGSYSPNIVRAAGCECLLSLRG
jgi:hypothetical protein